MATMAFDADQTVRDLIAGLSLVQGSSYRIQNVDSTDRLFMRAGPATAPEVGTRAHILYPGDWTDITASDNEPWWVWSSSLTGSCKLAVTEVG